MRSPSKLLPATACLFLLMGGASTLLHTQPPPAAPSAGPAAAAPAPPPPSPPDQINLELTRRQRPKVRLALPAFLTAAQPAGEGAVERELEQTVRDDLQLSGYFDIQGPEAFKLQPLSGDVKRDLPAFASLGNEIVLLGTARAEAGKLVLEGRLFAFAVSLAHWGDIGGAWAGSYFAAATETWQEGVRIPPLRLFTAQGVDQEKLDFLLANRE